MVAHDASLSIGSAHSARSPWRPASALGRSPIFACSAARTESLCTRSLVIAARHALSVRPSAALLIHVSMLAPPHDVWMMPIGTSADVRRSRAKKYATAENVPTCCESAWAQAPPTTSASGFSEYECGIANDA